MPLVSAVKKFNVTPLADRVIVRPLSQDETHKKTASGIFIPETIEKEKPEQGEVVAVGPGKYEDGKLVPMRIMVGERVVFSKYGFDDIKIDGQEYYILREDSILAVIK